MGEDQIQCERTDDVGDLANEIHPCLAEANFRAVDYKPIEVPAWLASLFLQAKPLHNFFLTVLHTDQLGSLGKARKGREYYTYSQQALHCVFL